MTGHKRSESLRLGGVLRIMVIGQMLLCACVAQASVALPPESPEADHDKEVIAVSVGARNVIMSVVEDGIVVRSANGEPGVPLSSGRDARTHGCSISVDSADKRAQCEGYARLGLLRASPKDFSYNGKQGFARAASLTFERSSDREGVASTIGPAGPLRLSLSTPDEALTRVRLLGQASNGNPVILLESLQQTEGTLRWHSRVAAYDARGRVPAQVDLDGKTTRFPNGDYVVLNDQGELGILELAGKNIIVHWQQLQNRDASASLTAPTAALRIGEVANDTQWRAFDFSAFARRSTQIDGDEGRSSDRPITRAQVQDNIKAYLAAAWSMKASNYAHDGIPSECSVAGGKYWLRPDRLDQSVGQDMSAMPYKWGGYISVDRFVSQMIKGQLAGSVCTCSDPSKGYCVVDFADGVDCSGFVSRVWGVGRYTTATLDQITEPVEWSELRPGDALNKPGHHVRIFLEMTRGSEIGVRIAESSVSCGGVCERVLTARELDGYQPRRFKLIRD